MGVREERHPEKEFTKDGKEGKEGKGSGETGADQGDDSDVQTGDDGGRTEHTAGHVQQHNRGDAARRARFGTRVPKTRSGAEGNDKPQERQLSEDGTRRAGRHGDKRSPGP